MSAQVQQIQQQIKYLINPFQNEWQSAFQRTDVLYILIYMWSKTVYTEVGI